jgi:hypothetical protein
MHDAGDDKPTPDQTPARRRKFPVFAAAQQEPGPV